MQRSIKIVAASCPRKLETARNSAKLLVKGTESYASTRCSPPPRKVSGSWRLYRDSPKIAAMARRRSDMSGLGGGRRSSSKEKVLVAAFFLLKYIGVELSVVDSDGSGASAVGALGIVDKLQ